MRRHSLAAEDTKSSVTTVAQKNMNLPSEEMPSPIPVFFFFFAAGYKHHWEKMFSVPFWDATITGILVNPGINHHTGLNLNFCEDHV